MHDATEFLQNLQEFTPEATEGFGTHPLGAAANLRGSVLATVHLSPGKYNSSSGNILGTVNYYKHCYTLGDLYVRQP